MERTGVATAEEAGPEILRQRVSEELAAAVAVFAYPTLISAWARSGEPRPRLRPIF